jgi:adenylate cyclase
MTAEAHTFMFADISGYSLLAELDGDEAAADIALGLMAKAAGLARGRRAEVIKCLGDGVMVHARDAADAVQMGLELLAGWAQDPSLPAIHIGVHTGPALRRAGDWWGSTVNTAARVAGARRGGTAPADRCDQARRRRDGLGPASRPRPAALREPGFSHRGL